MSKLFSVQYGLKCTALPHFAHTKYLENSTPVFKTEALCFTEIIYYTSSPEHKVLKVSFCDRSLFLCGTRNKRAMIALYCSPENQCR